jgi:DNA modification methylase
MAKRSRKTPPAAPTIQFTASEIVMRNVDELKPFPNNPKIHTPAQVDAIAANITAFGFDQPILIDEHDTILKGHGRQLGSRKAGLVLVPTICRPGLSIDDKWAIVISDNALPAMTGFDQSLLRVGLTQLAKVDYPLHLTGIENVHLATFIGTPAGGAAPNDIPQPESTAISRRGDVWLLGAHRLICGDSSNAKTVEKLLGDDEPAFMCADPPYKFETRGSGLYLKPSTNHNKRAKDAGVSEFEVSQLCELRETNAIFTSKGLLGDYLDLAREKKLDWDVAVLHRQAAMPAHNGHLIPDLDYIVLIGKLAPKRGLETAEYSKLFSTGHWERPVPWAKPVELISRLIRLYTAVGDSVFEPYCGSGTTIIAAEMLGRRCLAFELDPVFADLAVRRWEKFAKQKATLQGTKRSFDQVVKERSPKAAA